MRIEFDPAKTSWNVQARGLSFDRVGEFDFETAYLVTDTRRNYGEVRFRAPGLLEGRLHALVFYRADRWHSGHQLPQSQSTRGRVV